MNHTLETVLDERRKHQIFEHKISEAAGVGIASIAVIRYLLSVEGHLATFTDIHEGTGLSTTTVGAAIKTAIKANYLKKRRKPDDERLVEGYIPDEYIERVEALLLDADVLVEEVFNKVEPEPDENDESESESDDDIPYASDDAE